MTVVLDGSGGRKIGRLRWDKRATSEATMGAGGPVSLGIAISSIVLPLAAFSACIYVLFVADESTVRTLLD